MFLFIFSNYLLINSINKKFNKNPWLKSLFLSFLPFLKYKYPILKVALMWDYI